MEGYDMVRTVRTDSGIREVRSHEHRYLDGGCPKKRYATWAHARNDVHAINSKQNGAVVQVYRCADPDCRAIHVGRDNTVSPGFGGVPDRGVEVDESDLAELAPECIRAIRHAQRRRRAA